MTLLTFIMLVALYAIAGFLVPYVLGISLLWSLGIAAISITVGGLVTMTISAYFLRKEVSK